MQIIDYSPIIRKLKRTRCKRDIGISASDLAMVLGISQSSVSQIKMKYDLQQENGVYFYLLNTLRMLYKKKTNKSILETSDIPSDIPLTEEDMHDIKTCKIKLMKVKIEKEEFLLKQKKMEYIKISLVVEFLSRILGVLKSELLKLPRLSQQLIVCETDIEIKRLLEKNVDYILQNISNIKIDEMLNNIEEEVDEQLNAIENE